MDKKFISEQKQKLERQREYLNKKINKLEKVLDFGDSQDDNAQEVAEASNNLSLERDLKNELKEINKVLKRIDEGSYGKCLSCGGIIEKKRLELVPTAVNCADCQSKLRK
jgi:RNA polymerase-binding transcription factor DksA